MKLDTQALLNRVVDDGLRAMVQAIKSAERAYNAGRIRTTGTTKPPFDALFAFRMLPRHVCYYHDKDGTVVAWRAYGLTLPRRAGYNLNIVALWTNGDTNIAVALDMQDNKVFNSILVKMQTYATTILTYDDNKQQYIIA